MLAGLVILKVPSWLLSQWITCLFAVGPVEIVLYFHHSYFMKRVTNTVWKGLQENASLPLRSTNQPTPFCDKAQNHVWRKLSGKFKRDFQQCNWLAATSQLIYTADRIVQWPTSCVPWEKFKRAMFIPDLIISFSISTEREAGPAGSYWKEW